MLKLRIPLIHKERSDATRVLRPAVINPIQRKAQPGYKLVTVNGQVLEVPLLALVINNGRRLVVITPKLLELKLDNRSNYQKKEAEKEAQYEHLKAEQNKLNLASILVANLVSPAQHAGAAVRLLAGTNKSYMDDVVNGSGVVTEQFAQKHPTVAGLTNFTFDLATPLRFKGYLMAGRTLGRAAVRQLPLGPGLYVDALLWDGRTVLPSYFRSPSNWYRRVDYPEIEHLREVGHNITTRDAIDLPGGASSANQWRMNIVGNGLTTREGYWYIPLLSPFEKKFGIATKLGSAHGNTSLAAFGLLWNGGISGYSQLPSYVIEGGYLPTIRVGKNRTNFVETPIEEIPMGLRIGFRTGEIKAGENLGAFRLNANGTYTYEGPILLDKNMVTAPNGLLSDFTLEELRFVRSPLFKSQFGDWEYDPANASKIVTSKGEPMMVYHGTDVRFKTFDPSKFRYGAVGKGFYVGRGRSVFNNKPVMLKGFANSKKPLRLTDAQRETMFEDPIWEGKSGPTPMDIQQLGYDGVLVNYGKTPMSDFELVVYDPKLFILFKKGGLIYIKEKNKGKFTALAKKAGLSVQEHAKSVLANPNSTTLLKKRAIFALNAKKWR